MWTTLPTSRFFASLLLVTAHFAAAQAVEGPPNDALVPVVEAVVEPPVYNAPVDPAAPATEPVPAVDTAVDTAVDIATSGVEDGANPEAPVVTIPEITPADVVPAAVEPVISAVDVASASLDTVYDAAASVSVPVEAAVSSVLAVASPIISVAPVSITPAPVPTTVSTKVTSIRPVTSELPVQQNTTSTANHNGTYVHTTKPATRSFTTILVSSIYNTVTAQMPANTALPSGAADAAVSGAPEVVYTGGLDDSTLDKACWSGTCDDSDSKMTTAHVINMQQPVAENVGSRVMPVFGAVLALALGWVAVL